MAGPTPLYNLKATLLPSTTCLPDLGAILGDQCSASSEQEEQTPEQGPRLDRFNRACDVDR
jgi:hypothetical protein